MTRLAIAAGIYAALIRRSPRDFAAASDGPALRQAIDALACTALELADVLIAADARIPAATGLAQASAAVPLPAH
jgi:hypothetical protein